MPATSFCNGLRDRDQMKERAATLAAGGVYTGTSSWKYEGCDVTSLFAALMAFLREVIIAIGFATFPP